MLKKVAVLAVASALSFAGIAHGAQTPFSITDTVDFRTGARAFTATGPLCASGTYTDDVGPFAAPAEQSFPHSLANDGANVIIRTVFTCADASGTFTGLKHFQLTFTNDTSFTLKGQLELKGGTGPYTRLSGHATQVGAVVDEVGGAVATGMLR